MKGFLASALLFACVFGATGAAVADTSETTETGACAEGACHGPCITNVSLLLSDREEWLRSCASPIWLPILAG